MKRLCFLRHAKSSWSNPSLDDFDRPLSARGRGAADRMGLHLADLKPPIDLVYCSPAARARETLERAAEAFSDGPPVEYVENLYLPSLGTILEVVRGAPDEARTIMLVGHNPSFQDAVLSFAGNGGSPGINRVAAKFPTCAFAALNLPVDHWSETKFGIGGLDDIVYVRDLTG